MGLGGALNIGRTALLSYQTAIEVTGNNLANVGSRGYHRQVVTMSPIPDQEIMSGVFVGRGVQIESIRRMVDNALEGRLRQGLANEAGTNERASILAQIEAIHNELSDKDLSTKLGEFFNAFSDLANRPLDDSLRALVIQQGASLSSFLRQMRTSMVDLRNLVDRSVDQNVSAANDLLGQIQEINRKIATADGATGGANALRDQRDVLLAELATYFDFSAVEQGNGAVDVYVNSLPVVLGGDARGLAVRRTLVDGETKIELTIAADGSVIAPASGKLGAMVAAREGDLVEAIRTLDDFAGQLIFQVNRLHSQGQGIKGFTNVTGTYGVADVNARLNDAATTGLKFLPGHGSFELHVTQQSTGLREMHLIQLDLDGINPAGDTTLADLAAQINAVANVNASITADGRLRVDTVNGDYQITFGNDSSGVLAALGINTYFTGTSAQDVDVNNVIKGNPSLLAVGQGHVSGDNRNALAVAGLRTKSVAELGGITLMESWNRHVEQYAIRQGQTLSELQAATIVRENLESQQQSVSGVNTDEETINLLAFQRAYQAGARFLNVVDEMYQTLLQIV